MGDSAGVPGFLLCSGPGMAVVAISGMNQWLKVLFVSPSLSLCLSNKIFSENLLNSVLAFIDRGDRLEPECQVDAEVTHGGNCRFVPGGDISVYKMS